MQHPTAALPCTPALPAAAPQEWDGTAELTGLTNGQRYTLYKFTDLGGLPTKPTDKINPRGAAW